MIYERPNLAGPFRQCEILSGLRRAVLDLAAAERNALQVDFEAFAYAVLMEQDCDLEQHHAALQNQAAGDKLLRNFLFLPAVPFETFRAGYPRDILRRIITNKDERFHVVERVTAEHDTRGEGLPGLAMDFKQHFSMPVGEFALRIREGSATRRSRLATPWAEHLSSRYSYFRARVGLPRDHDVAAGTGEARNP